MRGAIELIHRMDTVKMYIRPIWPKEFESRPPYFAISAATSSGSLRQRSGISSINDELASKLRPNQVLHTNGSLATKCIGVS